MQSNGGSSVGSARRRVSFVVAVALVSVLSIAVTAAVVAAQPPADGPKGPYEVWLIDQKDSRQGAGGMIHIFGANQVIGDPDGAEAETVDLGEDARQMCVERTGSAPERPHMLVFNGGDRDARGGNTDAAIAFVGTGHVLFMDAASREPTECIDVGTQAHAVWPTPDQRHLLVANQNGKLFQRIATDYETDTFRLEDDATLDLANCTTPSGAPCQDPILRPDNAPICPRTTSDGRFTFATLRGGGMFVVDHNQTPMRIVAEYDRDTVDDNGCGEMESNGKMYVNSGAGPPGEPFGHVVYSFDLDEFDTEPGPANSPAPEVVYSRQGEVDAHAVAVDKHSRYLWVGDRIQNDVTVVDTRTDEVVNRFSLEGEASPDPAPDLFDLSPSGNRMYASLRGPEPATGDHDAIGSTPGLGVIRVTEGGRSGELAGVARVQGTLSSADPHAVRVRSLR